MAQAAAGAVGPVDPREVVLLQGANDERVAVASASARFEAALAKSDMLPDGDASAPAKRIREKVLVEETMLNAARGRLLAARAELAAFAVAACGAASSGVAGTSTAKLNEDDTLERKESRLLKRKLPSPKDGWKDARGANIVSFADRHRLFQNIFDMFWKLRGVLREQAEAAPVAANAAERALGVKRSNLPDPDDFEERLEAMTVREVLELGLNQLHEAGCALYIKYRYNQAVVDNFLGDEFVGAERKQPLKERMATSVKEVQKQTAQALKAVGVA